MLTWPTEFMAPGRLRWHISGASKPGPRSASGLTRFSSADGGGFWRCEMARDVHDMDMHRTALALVDRLYGGSALVVVPYHNYGLAPYPLGAAAEAVPYSDGVSFSDGSSFITADIEIAAAASALRGATTINLLLGNAAGLRGGEPFSFSHEDVGKRVYRVNSVKALGGGVFQVGFMPPLRGAVSDGDGADFNTPGCIMRLTNADEVLGIIEPPFRFTVMPKFEEAWD